MLTRGQSINWLGCREQGGLSYCEGASKANNSKDFEIGQTIRIGARGFEPPTPCTPCKCATRLRHAPISILEFVVRGLKVPESVSLRILSLARTTFLEGSE